jgi:mRNA interferase RelE/StbE
MAVRIRAAIAAYAATGAHRNNVTQLVGPRLSRLRVGDFRVIFAEDADEILVLKVGPRGDVYE